MVQGLTTDGRKVRCEPDGFYAFIEGEERAFTLCECPMSKSAVSFDWMGGPGRDQQRCRLHVSWYADGAHHDARWHIAPEFGRRIQAAEVKAAAERRARMAELERWEADRRERAGR